MRSKHSNASPGTISTSFAQRFAHLIPAVQMQRIEGVEHERARSRREWTIQWNGSAGPICRVPAINLDEKLK